MFIIYMYIRYLNSTHAFENLCQCVCLCVCLCVFWCVCVLV